MDVGNISFYIFIKLIAQMENQETESEKYTYLLKHVSLLPWLKVWRAFCAYNILYPFVPQCCLNVTAFSSTDMRHNSTSIYLDIFSFCL